MANKLFWQIIILVGLVPFIIPVFKGVGAATLDFTSSFNFSLFCDQIFSYTTENWLTYIMGILLILISIKHLKID